MNYYMNYQSLSKEEIINLLQEKDKQINSVIIQNINNYTIKELKKISKYYNIKGYGILKRKQELVIFLKDRLELSFKNYTDISEIPNINIILNTKLNKNWIKQIFIEDTILFNQYKRNNMFKYVLDIVLDNSKRKTLLMVKLHILENEYVEKCEYIYIFTINNRIVKIGGTRNGLKGRFTSYLCGHHIMERQKSGYCSRTNGFIYNTFEFYLNLGCEIKMYALKLPLKVIDIDFLMKVILNQFKHFIYLKVNY